MKGLKENIEELTYYVLHCLRQLLRKINAFADKKVEKVLSLVFGSRRGPEEEVGQLRQPRPEVGEAAHVAQDEEAVREAGVVSRRRVQRSLESNARKHLFHTHCVIASTGSIVF
jgi:hypothetical protein